MALSLIVMKQLLKFSNTLVSSILSDLALNSPFIISTSFLFINVIVSILSVLLV